MTEAEQQKVKMTILIKHYCPSTLWRNWGTKTLSLLTLVGMLILLPSCSNGDKATNRVPELQGKIASYNEFGGAMVDFTAAQMTEAGFTFGDVVSITIGGKVIDVPYYDGDYGKTGEYLFVAKPSYPTICLTASNIGLPKDLRGLEGQLVVVRMKIKAGKLDVQQAQSMTYTFDRNDYPSDEAYANARAVNLGQLAHNRLHRCSSPFDNSINRAFYASQYLKKVQVKTVLDLADTEEMMQHYDMPAYSRTLWKSGNVILCQLKYDPTAADFNNRLIAALKELPSHEGPYVVHCLKGKSRTGYVCALLEGLCGASYQEIVDDYLITYANLYKKTPEKDPEVCNAMVSSRLNNCLMYYAGVDDEALLPGLDYQKVFSDYLLSHGMTSDQLNALVNALTKETP